MINFRYHVVSLSAVFLALAVGVIAGTTVIDQQLVQDLQRQRNRDAQAKEELRQTNAALEDQVRLWERFGDVMLGPLFGGRLRGRRVVALVEPSFPTDLLDRVDESFAAAGSARGGRLTLTSKWRLEDQPAREQLALLLGVSQTERDELLQEAAARLGARLLAPADPTADGDLVESLVEAGFAEAADMAPGVFPPRNALVVFFHSGIAGGPLDAGFSLRLLRAVAGTLPAAIAEPLGAADSLVDRVRGDADLMDDVGSVDHVDTLPGRYSLVVVLEDLAEGLPAPHYGVRRRASAVAPIGER